MSTHPDQIKIELLRTHGIIGLRNPERLTPQDILVSVTLDLDLRAICQSDNVADGVNYSDVSRRIFSHVSMAERHTIESLATDIAGICLSYERVTQVRVRVSKPAADRNAQAVAVEITRTRADLLTPAIIALGSNDSPEKKLPEAVVRLRTLGHVIRASAVYETQSVGAAAQHPYLNAAVRLDTVLPAAEIRRQLKKIEQEMGRTDDSKATGQIPIDLDLCLLGEQIIRASDVSIPHADLTSREYVARACAEVAPDVVHPETHQWLSEIAGQLAGTLNLTPRNDVKFS